MQLDVEPPFVLFKPVDHERAYYDGLDEDSPWELLGGRLAMSPASERHEDLFRFLLTLFSGHLDERGGAVVRGSRYPMRLDPQWSPEPELLVVTDANRHRMTSRRLEGPGDLVVEIASDGDPGLDEREKLPRYEAAAIPEIWLVHPQTETLLVRRLQPGGTYVGERLAGGRLDSSVIPGFWLDVEWKWQDRLPSTLACLRQILGWSS
ncbi:MAG: Uma2 family endonuclease [Euzebyaceae bacterium]|nr:Uma2 family endonuclease [Euzebyaceae bacterium]